MYPIKTFVLYKTLQSNLIEKLTLSCLWLKQNRTRCNLLVPTWTNCTKLPSSQLGMPSLQVCSLTTGCWSKAYNLRLTRCNFSSWENIWIWAFFELFLLLFMRLCVASSSFCELSHVFRSVVFFEILSFFTSKKIKSYEYSYWCQS